MASAWVSGREEFKLNTFEVKKAEGCRVAILVPIRDRKRCEMSRWLGWRKKLDAAAGWWVSGQCLQSFRPDAMVEKTSPTGLVSERTPAPRPLSQREHRGKLGKSFPLTAKEVSRLLMQIPLVTRVNGQQQVCESARCGIPKAFVRWLVKCSDPDWDSRFHINLRASQ